jgi:hypothetical protein
LPCYLLPCSPDALMPLLRTAAVVGTPVVLPYRINTLPRASRDVPVTYCFVQVLARGSQT